MLTVPKQLIKRREWEGQMKLEWKKILIIADEGTWEFILFFPHMWMLKISTIKSQLKKDMTQNDIIKMKESNLVSTQVFLHYSLSMRLKYFTVNKI